MYIRSILFKLKVILEKKGNVVKQHDFDMLLVQIEREKFPSTFGKFGCS